MSNKRRRVKRDNVIKNKGNGQVDGEMRNKILYLLIGNESKVGNFDKNQVFFKNT